MSVSDWISKAVGVETYEPFSGRLVTGGTLVNSPVFVAGVDGQALQCEELQGATLFATPRVSTGYPISVSCWVSFQPGAKTSTVFQWGTTPSVGVTLFGEGSAERPGTLEASVRMSNGKYAARLRSTPLLPGRWHLVTITVEASGVWGGCRVYAYVDGEQIGTGSYAGSLFDIVNFNRPTMVTVGVSSGTFVIDEWVAQEHKMSAAEAKALFQSADSLVASSGAGWGIVF